MTKRSKRIAAIAAPILFAGVLYLGGTGSMGTVLARTVTTVIRTKVVNTIVETAPYHRTELNQAVGGITIYTKVYTTGITVTEDEVTEGGIITDLTTSYEVADQVVKQTTPREKPMETPEAAPPLPHVPIPSSGWRSRQPQPPAMRCRWKGVPSAEPSEADR